MTETIFTRQVLQRMDYWDVYMWQVSDGKRSAAIHFIPHGKDCHRRKYHSRWAKCGWRNGEMFPIAQKEVDKFFRWWRQGSFECVPT